ncbi:HNH endonuclease [Aridibaculum aurantiacum]|uniref:HNH endonuclease n=1 Tax=Aridibaculum aurantiacum TaxID=2810307 RepID=UPI001A96D246|nr:HNH endonuclease [Aridibaculum aurantiacum]
MLKDLPGEQWKTVLFNFNFANDYKLLVSNYGRLKTYNKINKGQLLKGSTIKGYKIVRLKFYKARDAKTEERFENMHQQITLLVKKNSSLKKQLNLKKITADEVVEVKKKLENNNLLLQRLKLNLRRDMEKDLQARVIHYHSLVHRLVAEYFCPRPSPEHSIVAHLDFAKQNNRSDNLAWMTPEENILHQQKSPNVITSRANRKEGNSYNPNSKVNKLTITKVMLLKKLLSQGKPIKTLVKQFKITDTQILRIKRGENWGYVEAAK